VSKVGRQMFSFTKGRHAHEQNCSCLVNVGPLTHLSSCLACYIGMSNIAYIHTSRCSMPKLIGLFSLVWTLHVCQVSP